MTTTGKKLFDEFSKLMPDNKTVIAEGVKIATAKFGNTPEAIKKNFSALVHTTHDEIYRIYLEHERKRGEAVLASFIKGARNTPLFPVLNDFFLSLGNSRMSRAGSAFEEIIRGLFKRCNYPFEEKKLINGRPDFVMPSEKHFHTHAADCIIFTAKRTLRERWRQIVTEGSKSARFFLATMDARKRKAELGAMLDRNISLVISADLLSENPDYKKAPNVISFEDFFEDHLDPAVARWKKQHAI
jgi:superfamily II DNA/RNA helicase